VTVSRSGSSAVRAAKRVVPRGRPARRRRIGLPRRLTYLKCLCNVPAARAVGPALTRPRYEIGPAARERPGPGTGGRELHDAITSALRAAVPVSLAVPAQRRGVPGQDHPDGDGARQLAAAVMGGAHAARALLNAGRPISPGRSAPAPIPRRAATRVVAFQHEHARRVDRR
jgi:hypothetical protein